jgi:hypothetical protein
MAKEGKKYVKIGSSWEQIKPSYDDLVDVPTDFNPTTHTHGNMNDDGQISASATIASGDHLVIADDSANNDLTTSSITFGTSTTQFLRNNGTWGTPSGSDSSKLPLTGGTLSGDLELDHDGETTANNSHGVNFRARFNNQDFTTLLRMESGGGLHFGTDEVYHEGHKPTYTELGTMAYSNLTGTPTIPSNNNQLTNGAGYISSFDITTQTDGKYLRSNANDDFSGTLNYTPDTGTILSVDGQAILQRMTANGAITIGHDDAVIIAGGDTSGVLNSNITNSTETVFVGAEGGFVAYAFPSNNTAWSNRKEMKWDGTNLSLLGNNVLTTADEGSGNGIDADTLDGSHASTFAPKASPALTGTPTAPTAAANTNTTQIATTAYVQTEISDLIGGAPLALDTLNELAAAINDDASYAAGITTALAGKMSTSHPANNHTSTHLYMANGDGFIWNDTTNVMSVRKDGTDYTNWDSGNLTNLNQLTNGPGYVTSSGVTSVATGSGLTGGTITGSGTLSHADTSSQASVNNSGNTFIQDITLDGFGHITGLTSATASTTDSTKLPLAGGTMTGDLVLDHDGTGTTADSHALRFTARAANTDFSREIKLEDGGGFAFDSNILLTGDVTTSNQARTIDFTGFDKEGTTDFSDRAYIQHTTNTGGHSGSVLVISSQNDSTDGIAFSTNGSSQLKHNSNTIWDAGNDGSGSGLDADLLDGNHASAFYLASNPDGYTTNAGTVTSVQVGVGAGLDVSGGPITASGTINLSLDLSEFTDMTADVNGLQDELILLDNGAERRKLISEIKLSQFNNDAGFTTASGDIEGVTAGDGLTGGGTTGTVTISHADTSSQASVNNSGRTYIQDITLDTYGHITGITSATETVTNTDTNTQLSNEQVQDIVGAMVSSNSESGISVTYQDTDGTLDFNVNDPTITLTGDVTGSATMTNLGNVSITATVADDSHNHTIANIDNLQTSLNGKLSTTAAAAAVSYVTSCPTSTNSTGMKVYVGSTDCSTKYSGWLYLIT